MDAQYFMYISDLIIDLDFVLDGIETLGRTVM